jgi:hypothetical protein
MTTETTTKRAYRVRDEHGQQQDLASTSLQTARTEAEEWLGDGEYETMEYLDDGSVRCSDVEVGGMLIEVTTDEDGDEDEEDVESLTVTIEGDHEDAMRAAGGMHCARCDHEWVSTEEIDGGLRENPGCWSGNGTTMQYQAHCSVCGLSRSETCRGSQRNPGETDRTTYTAPDEASVGPGDVDGEGEMREYRDLDGARIEWEDVEDGMLLVRDGTICRVIAVCRDMTEEA